VDKDKMKVFMRSVGTTLNAEAASEYPPKVVRAGTGFVSALGTRLRPAWNQMQGAMLEVDGSRKQGSALFVVATKDSTLATLSREHVCYEGCKKDHSIGDAQLEDGKTCIFQNAGAAHSVMPSRRKAFDARRCGLRTWVVG
jgi:hypothetical protein